MRMDPQPSWSKLQLQQKLLESITSSFNTDAWISCSDTNIWTWHLAKKSFSSLPPHLSTGGTASSVSICTRSMLCLNSMESLPVGFRLTAPVWQKSRLLCVIFESTRKQNRWLNSVDRVLTSKIHIISEHLASRSRPSSYLSALETTAVRSVCSTFRSRLSWIKRTPISYSANYVYISYLLPFT